MKALPPTHDDVLDTDVNRFAKITLIVIIVFFGGFIAWGTLVPLYSGVVVGGVVKTVTHDQIIRAPLTDKVVEILVKEGDKVKKGQLLIKLDTSDAQAQLSKVRNQYLYLLATKIRLIAEINKKREIKFPKVLTEAAQKDPHIRKMLDAQKELFYSDMNNLKQQIEALKEEINSLKAKRQGYIMSAKSIKSQMYILSEQINSLKSLVQENFYPKIQYLDKVKDYEDLKATYENIMGQIQQLEGNINEDMVKIKNIETDFMAKNQDKLSQIETQLDTYKQMMIAAKETYKKCFIRSPVNGDVVMLTIHTIGTVVREGEELGKILPEDQSFIIEASVPPTEIAKIHVGSKAFVFFTSLNRSKTPEVEGKVIYISADTVFNPVAKKSYYLAKIKLTREGLKKLPLNQIKIGMTASVKIQAGARTMLEYLLKPLLDNFHTAFKI